MDRLRELVEELPFWDRLSDGEKAEALDGSYIKTYKKGAHIHSLEDCLGMIVVVSGEIRAYILSDEGREVTLFRIYEKEPCVMSASCVMSQLNFDTHISAERDTELLVIGSAAFQRLTERNVYVRCFMYELLTERFSAVMWVMEQILFFGFDKRLATFFVREYERTGSMRIAMTHEQIARDIGSAREVVARMCKRFSSEGLIESERGSVVIKDIYGLKEYI